MPVAPKQDARLRPALADMPRQPAQMSANLDAGRRLARTQHDGDGSIPVGVVDMDRQEATFVVVRIEQRELLMPLHDIERVVDVEGDRRGRAFIRVHPLVDERIAQPDRVLREGAFSRRDSVGCEQRSRSVSGNRPQASLKAGSARETPDRRRPRSRTRSRTCARGSCRRGCG